MKQLDDYDRDEFIRALAVVVIEMMRLQDIVLQLYIESQPKENPPLLTGD